MLIPYQSLDSGTLTNLIESFILREGTDYGIEEISLAHKSQKVLQQIENGEVLILYSELSESVTLIHKQQFNEQSSQ
ncbi:YheU family protein [Psychromonas hadalis]|uniref:YheU family protein n=1 Tax=Psychromonas hadalis TaxID=211669 RepID=UPI0003B75868|nr:YheU family protein [Psychromonas hadalis]